MKLAGGAGRGGIVDFGGGSYFAPPHYRMKARKLPMEVFATLLGSVTDRAVLDRTGLTGRYGFNLDSSSGRATARPAS